MHAIARSLRRIAPRACSRAAADALYTLPRPHGARRFAFVMWITLGRDAAEIDTYLSR